MKFTDSLKGIGSPIAFYPDLIPLVGSKTAAMLICQLAYWTGKQHNPDGWIYKTQEEWFFETGLSDKEQRTARRDLVQRGYIEERLRGIPRRLEYRLLEKPLDEIWDTWMIAVSLKKEFQTLSASYGVMISRGIQIEEVQIEMEKFRQVIWKCYNVAEGFFDSCLKLKITPVDIVDKFREKLSQLAQTLDKFRSSHWAGQSLTSKQSTTKPTVTSVPPPQADQCQTKASLAEPETLTLQAVQTPSKSTKKNTINTPQVSTQAAPENTHIEGQSVNSLQEKKKNEAKEEFGNTVEVEVIQDTQQEPEDKELKSQGQDCIFMKKNIPGGAGGENFEIEKTPDWVQEYEDKVRSGGTLPRSELVKLAEYRLGAYASLYRDSGRVLDASPNDIKPEFLRFLQWYAFNRNPDISFVRATVAKTERNPEQWGVLLCWLTTFQQVLDDPSVLGTMLAAKVSSAGRNGNKQDLALNNRLVLQNVFKK